MQITKQVRLLFSDLKVGGHSDKEYSIQFLADGEQGAAVAAQYGRRGAALTSGYLTQGAGWSKTVVVMTPAQAQAAYDRKLNEKLSDGYIADAPAVSPGAPTEVSTPSSGVERAGEPPCELLTEIDEATALRLVEDPLFWMQKKENGRRLQIRKHGSRVDGINRKGQIVPLPPELANDAGRLPHDTFLTDGEAIGEETIAFDLLDADGDLREQPYGLRFSELLAILARAESGGSQACHIRPVQTWFTVEDKRAGLKFLRESRAEGAVFKRIDAPFHPGRNGQHFKLKFVKSLTAKILPKNAKDAAKGHNSITLGLLNSAGEWVEVGHASAIGKGELPLGAHVEIKYLYGYGSAQAPHLVQARVEGLRDDLNDADCTIAQVQFHEGQGNE
jgi:bifunctional non-homologous end joining protein LigD